MTPRGQKELETSLDESKSSLGYESYLYSKKTLDEQEKIEREEKLKKINAMLKQNISA